MSDYQTPVDIANRALQHCGARRITTLADTNDRASEIQACYDKLRQAELRRNVWAFGTRRVMLRPVDVDTMVVTFPTYALSSSYPKFFPVVLPTNGRVYQSQAAVAASTNQISDNTAGSVWTRYFACDTAQPYDDEESYLQGELVYSPAGDVFMAITSESDADPTAGPPAWDATISYRAGDTVTHATLVYQSNADLNLNQTPGVAGWTLTSTLVTQVGFRVGQEWLQLTTATLSSMEFAYPLGSGPVSQPNSRNIYRLPVGFLREAPQAPKAGGTSYLGAAWGLPYNDWEYEGGYITSSAASGFVYRFAADSSDVRTFDPMFCEGLAARIALEICERVTQSDGKLSTIASLYGKFMSEARTVNGIETGPTEPAVDDYIACRN